MFQIYQNFFCSFPSTFRRKKSRLKRTAQVCTSVHKSRVGGSRPALRLIITFLNIIIQQNSSHQSAPSSSTIQRRAHKTRFIKINNIITVEAARHRSSRFRNTIEYFRRKKNLYAYRLRVDMFFNIFCRRPVCIVY